MKKALVVLSGGQDSTTALYWAKKNFDEVHALTFAYGQRHQREVESARSIAGMAQVASHEVVKCEGLLHSASPLLSSAPLEKYQNYAQMDQVIGNRTELTFVPMRNALFAVVAVNRAVELRCHSIVMGICAEDNANYPDCTEDFYHAVNNMIGIALGRGYYVRIEAPLLFSTKAETVKLAMSLPGCMVALAFSHTSYDGKFPPTDMNHANVLRAHGFEEAGIADPLVVRAWALSLMELPDTPNYTPIRSANVSQPIRSEVFNQFVKQFS